MSRCSFEPTALVRHRLNWIAPALASALSLCLGAAQASTPLPVASYSLSVNGPNNGYGYDDPGTDLTDGQYGMQVGGGYSAWSPYVLWDGVSPTITFDLSSTQRIGQIVGYFLTYPGAAVYLPLLAQASFSDDGVTYSPPVSRPTGYTASMTLRNDVPVTLTLLEGHWEARYVQLTLETPGRWFALSEVQFMPSAVPEPLALAQALAGLGVLGWLMGRRRSA